MHLISHYVFTVIAEDFAVVAVFYSFINKYLYIFLI